MTSRISSPVKYFGGKYYIAKDIVRLFPSKSTYLNYVEPYCGGASVFFAASDLHVGRCSEVLNDKYETLINFFKVLQDKFLFEEFHRIISLQPFAEQSFEEWWTHLENLLDINKSLTLTSQYHEGNMLDEAIAFFIVNRMSWAGRMTDFAAITKKRLRGGKNEQVNAWLGAIDKLPEIAMRLQHALILNRDALQVINNFNDPKTLFYLDPPYLLGDTGVRTNKDGGEYKHEMTYEQHEAMLSIISLDSFKAKFLLSCYDNKLYNDYAHDYRWKRHEIKCVERSSGAANERIEVVYANY